MGQVWMSEVKLSSFASANGSKETRTEVVVVLAKFIDQERFELDDRHGGRDATLNCYGTSGCIHPRKVMRKLKWSVGNVYWMKY